MDLKEIGWKGLDWYILGIEKAADSCEPGDESSSSINSEKFLDQLKICWLFKQGSAPWKELTGNKPFRRLYMWGVYLFCNSLLSDSLTS